MSPAFAPRVPPRPLPPVPQVTRQAPRRMEPRTWHAPAPVEACAVSTTVRCEVATASSQASPARCLHDHELHLIGAAPGRLRIGSGDDERTHSFAPHTVVLLGPHLPRSLAFEHRMQPGGGDTQGLVLRFGDEPLKRGMALFPELADAGPMLARARLGVQFIGLEADTLARLRRIATLHGLARFSEFTALLNELAQWPDYRLLCGVAPSGEDLGEDARSLRIDKALDHIREHYADALSLPEVGAIVGMRENTFSRSFRRATGQTFTDFVIGLRVAEACRLLVSTRQQVSSICYEVGFNNISNFNRHFRRIQGMTPGEFRARRAGERRVGDLSYA